MGAFFIFNVYSQQLKVTGLVRIVVLEVVVLGFEIIFSRNLRVEIMGFQIKLFSISTPSVDPEFIGSCEYELGDTYVKFQVLLEEIGIVDWPFQFWNSKINSRINKKLERLNKVLPNMYVILNSNALVSCTKNM
jgi:hypothetical protein